MALDLDAVQVFLKVAELGSFTRAANQLGLAKSRASLVVQALEKDLGARLLQRTTRTVKLTEEGELFVERARTLAADAEELSTLFSAPSTLRGRLRVDLPVNLARDRIIPRLPEFFAAHPGLELQLSCTDRRVDVLKEGFDCVVRVGPLGESTLQAKRLGALAMVNCVSPSYLVKYGAPTKLQDLERHYVVHYSTRLSPEGCGFEYFDGKRFVDWPMRALITVNSVDAYHFACRAGLGIVQAPRSAVAQPIANGELVQILPDHNCAPLPVSLVHAYGRAVPRRVRVFMDWVSRALAPYLATAKEEGLLKAPAPAPPATTASR